MGKPLRILAMIVVLILIGAALYWVGLWQGRSQLEAERKNFNAQLEQMNSKMVASEYNMRLNLARFLLCRTVQDLDQRNFGLASNHLKEAYAALGSINASMVGLDQGRFETLRKDIGATEISVAVNLDEQRGRVYTYAELLESLLPRTPALTAAPAQPPTQQGSTQPPAAPGK